MAATATIAVAALRPFEAGEPFAGKAALTVEPVRSSEVKIATAVTPIAPATLAPIAQPSALASAATVEPVTAPVLAAAEPRPVSASAAHRPSPGAGSSPERSRPAPTDPESTRLKAQIEKDLDLCRCSGAQDATQRLAARPGGAALAHTFAARLSSCRPIDVDHRCVRGALVEMESP